MSLPQAALIDNRRYFGYCVRLFVRPRRMRTKLPVSAAAGVEARLFPRRSCEAETGRYPEDTQRP